MYCTIIEKKMLKQPYKSGVYKKLTWKPYGDDPLRGYWDGEDEIEREPREKWNIILNESYRVNGKVKKKQYHIATITYWNIIDGWYSEIIYEGMEAYIKGLIMDKLGITKKQLEEERKSPGFERPLKNKINEAYNALEVDYLKAEYDKLESLIYDKFQPIIDRVKAEYEQSEEYYYKCQNERLKKAKEAEIKAKEEEIKREQEYQSKKYQYDSMYGQGYYDAHYNKDGSPKFNSEEAKAWDEAHKDSKEQQYRRYYDYSSFNWGNTGFSAALNLSDSEKEIAAELIKAGYRTLAMKYHPDKGGDEEVFKQVTAIKDKIMKII